VEMHKRGQKWSCCSLIFIFTIGYQHGKETVNEAATPHLLQPSAVKMWMPPQLANRFHFLNFP